MSKHKELTGQGGKGSVNRVSDIRKYQAEFDRIFGSKDNAKPTTKTMHTPKMQGLPD